MKSLPSDIAVRESLWTPPAPMPLNLRDKAVPMNDRLVLAQSKAEIVKSGIDEAGMSFPAVISTIDVDRMRDVVVPEGCQLEQYALSPVIFFGHQQMPLPIGQARDPSGKLHVFIEPGRQIVSRCFIAQRGRWAETAADVFHLIAEGVLSGISIGFDPVEYDKLAEGGNRFTRWNLLEWSAVGIAANPACNVIRRYLSRGRITGKSINPMLVKSLEPLAETAPEWANGWSPDDEAQPIVININLPKGTVMAKKNRPVVTTFGKLAMKRMQAAAARAKALTVKKDMAATDGAAGGYTVPEGMGVRTVRALKESFPDKPTAEEKVKSLGYKVDDYAESEESHDFHQGKAEEFEDETKEDEIEPGLKALLAKARKAEQASEDAPPKCAPKKGTKDMPSETPAETMEQEESGNPDEQTNPKGDDDPTLSLPSGAACAAHLLSYLRTMIPTLEPEVSEFFAGLVESVGTWASERYPEVDFDTASDEDPASNPNGPPETAPAETAEEETEEETEAPFTSEETAEEEEATEDDEPAEEDDDEDADELAAAYRSVPGLTKRLHKRGLTVIRDASDYLQEHADEDNLTRGQRAAVQLHCKALDRLHKEFSRPSKPVEADEERGLDCEKILAALSPVTAQMKANEKKLASLVR